MKISFPYFCPFSHRSNIEEVFEQFRHFSEYNLLGAAPDPSPMWVKLLNIIKSEELCELAFESFYKQVQNLNIFFESKLFLVGQPYQPRHET